MAMRMVSLNTWKCDGDYRRRVRLMGRGLAALAPDVVCLQECFRSAEVGVDSAAALGAATGLSVVARQARCKARDFEGEPVASSSGLAILVRHRLIGSGVLPLPSDSRDGERLALFVDLRVQQRRLRIVCTHLTHLRDSALRAQQARALLALDDGTADAVIVAGDFNARITDASLGALAERCHRGTDAAADAGTYLGSAVAIGRSERPRSARAIDQLLLLGGARRGWLSRPSVVLARPDAEGVYPSDHTGVFARWHPGGAVRRH